MRRQVGVGAIASATAVAMFGGAAGALPASAQDDHVVLSVGHTDALDVHYEDGQLSLMVKDDTSPPPVVRDPADVIFQALPESAIQVPNDPRYSFLGEPGDTIWVLPQVQDPNLLWPGWSTERLGAGVFVNNRVTLSLVGVDGPGMLSVFTVDAFGGPDAKWHYQDGEIDPSALDVPINTHAHANWAFDAEGTYTLTFQADATLAAGGTVTTGPVDYTFVVGDLPQTPDVELTISGMQASYAPGDTVTLAAVQNPPTSEDNYNWYRQCPGDGEFSVISGELEETYSFTAELELDGCQYRVRLFDRDHAEIAASAAVTLTVSDPADPTASQEIIATIDEVAGALILSVDPDDRTVVMTAAELNAAGDRLVSTGTLRPVTVTDTRGGAPGWNASGQLSDFSGSAGSFEGSYLGWAPRVLSQSDGQGVQAGAPVPSGFTSGDGLAVSRTLGSAASGNGLGTATLDADLALELPTHTPAGEYVATLTLTAI